MRGTIGILVFYRIYLWQIGCGQRVHRQESFQTAVLGATGAVQAMA